MNALQKKLVRAGLEVKADPLPKLKVRNKSDLKNIGLNKAAPSLKALVKEAVEAVGNYDARGEVQPIIEDILSGYGKQEGDKFLVTMPENWQDILWEKADGLVDIYNADLLKWISKDLNNAQYIEDAVDQGLIEVSGKKFDFFNLLQVGQYQFYYEALAEAFQHLESQGYL